MQGFWQVVDRRWRIFCLLARKKDMSFESWTCGNHWEPWEGLDSTHCWANQWWIDDWICRCLDHFGFLPSPDPPGRAQGPPEVQPTWKSCSGTWFCHIQHPHLMISLLGRVILQGTGCILDFASFRFVGLVTSIASEQQVGKLHVPSWCFFFNFIRESVCMPMVFIYVTILFPETQRYFALGLLAINAVTDQQVQLMVKTENQSWKSPESLHCNWFNGTNIRVSFSSYAGKGGGRASQKIKNKHCHKDCSWQSVLIRCHLQCIFCGVVSNRFQFHSTPTPRTLVIFCHRNNNVCCIVWDWLSEKTNTQNCIHTNSHWGCRLTDYTYSRCCFSWIPAGFMLWILSHATFQGIVECRQICVDMSIVQNVYQFYPIFGS